MTHAIEHKGFRLAYLRAKERAAYYLWCAIRGHTANGNDPMTGMKWSPVDDLAKEIGRASNKAKYRACRAHALAIAGGR